MLEWNHCWICAVTSTSTQQLRKTCTTHTHKPRIGQSSSIDAPTLFFTAKSTNTAQTYPSVTLAAAYPKPKKVHYKIKLQHSNATKSPPRNLCPSPMAATINHLLSSIVTRPHTTMFSGACICYLMSYFQKTVLFIFLPESESRLSGLSPLAVTYHVHAARFGDVWKSFGFRLGVAALYLGHSKAKQKSNEHWCATNYNSKNMCPLKCPDRKPIPVTTKCN